MISSTSTTSSNGAGGAGSSTSTKFKGVVLQHNGHWGAQIYAKHSRIWLGTFKSERAAAMAYDSAAMKLHRGLSPHRNFPPTESSPHEPAFQDLFTTEAVLDMIKDGSYEPKFAEFLKLMRFQVMYESEAMPPPTTEEEEEEEMVVGKKRVRKMFEKELTPSDVGKLNRLVIPKKQATMWFPAVGTMSTSEGEGEGLKFRDREGGRWVFRYCYWKSSQSYVFTKGWNRFVKEKGIKAKDVVGFYRCEEDKGYNLIDVVKRNANVDGGDHEEEEEGGGEGEIEVERVVVEEEEEEEVDSNKKKLRLFGAWI